MPMTEEHERAADLLAAVWRGVPAAYKSRYRMSIWQQFEDQIRAAAYTNNLGKFVNSLCSKLGATVGRNGEERQQAMTVLETAEAGPLLKLMREETTLLVLMVRTKNQERRDEWEAAHADEEEGADLPLFADDEKGD